MTTEYIPRHSKKTGFATSAEESLAANGLALDSPPEVPEEVHREGVAEMQFADRDEEAPNPEIVLKYSKWPLKDKPVPGDVVLIDLELRNPNPYAIDAELQLGAQFNGIFNNQISATKLQPYATFQSTVRGRITQLALDIGVLHRVVNIYVRPSGKHYYQTKISYPVNIRLR